VSGVSVQVSGVKGLGQQTDVSVNAFSSIFIICHLTSDFCLLSSAIEGLTPDTRHLKPTVY
jgi:hypothetical protein